MSALDSVTNSMLIGMEKINVASQNVANVNTTGYKKKFLIPNAQSDKNHLLHVTHDKNQGVLKKTGNSNDLAATGSGYFIVKNDGKQYITKNGEFEVNSEGYLVLYGSYKLQGESGDIFTGGEIFTVNKSGSIEIDGDVVDTIKLVHVDRKTTLKNTMKELFLMPDKDLGDDGKADIYQGYLENSNVDSKDEMIEMITNMRHFELQQKLLKSYDGLIKTGINELGKF